MSRAIARFLVLVLAACSLACAARPTPRTSAPPTVARPPTPRFVVDVDPRGELLAILFRLAQAEEYAHPAKTPYERAVDHHFGPHAEHPAVVHTRQLWAQGISYNAPYSLAFHLDAVPSLQPIRPLRPVPEGLDERWGGVDDLDRYLREVRAFVADTSFERFVAEHQDHYEAVERRFTALVERHEVLPWMQELFGDPQGATFVLQPGLLTAGHNYSTTATRADGTTEHVQVMWLEDIDDQGLPQPTKETLTVLVHELAHGYVNPRLEQMPDRVAAAFTRAFELTERQMTHAAYGQLAIVANETGVRTVTNLYALDHLGPADLAAGIESDQREGFAWMAETVAAADQARRTATPERSAFEAMLPAMLEAVERFAARYPDGLPYRGPLASAYALEPVAMIVPAGPGAAPLRAHVEEARAKLLPHATLIEPPQVTDGSTWFVYGSPTSNPVTAAILAELGWRVTADVVAFAGQQFEGEHLVLIAGVPQADAPSQARVLYAAADERDLVGIHRVRHDLNDWLVARRKDDGGFDVIARGDFEKSPDGRWRTGSAPPSTRPGG